MQWNRSNTVGLASSACSYCQGGGQRLVYKNHYAPCACVFRGIFRACLNRFRECANPTACRGRSPGSIAPARPAAALTPGNVRNTWRTSVSLPPCARRSSIASSVIYFLLGADWRLCGAR